MSDKGLQFYNPEGPKTSESTADQRLEFLESFRILSDPNISDSRTSKLISLKIDPVLLKLFRFKCEQNGIRYQTKIKLLMEDWMRY